VEIHDLIFRRNNGMERFFLPKIKCENMYFGMYFGTVWSH
jgi:hypothetical protein